MANAISVPREGHRSLGANVLFYLLIVATLSISTATAAELKWQTLPDTPELPIVRGRNGNSCAPGSP
ncbi:hypothetical protein SMB554_24695 (plasmid) [Sinorhizobium meliloti]|nr:hypothetical protein SMB554_24695 [Sinorhizobium meliloti]RVO92818.1 hypothetical protein CN089_19530 [Sinorhizobium meliloti]